MQKRGKFKLLFSFYVNHRYHKKFRFGKDLDWKLIGCEILKSRIIRLNEQNVKSVRKQVRVIELNLMGESWKHDFTTLKML